MKIIIPMSPEEALHYVDELHVNFGGRTYGKTLLMRFFGAARDALSRMVPKKPINRSKGFSFRCPTCHRELMKHEAMYGKTYVNNCKWCGQRFDWSDFQWNQNSR